MKKIERIHHILSEFDKESYRKSLIHWFKKEQRVLPWRENQDPYRVWVSEIMLQQTRVDTVIPYFNDFMAKFPTPEALADADEQDVLKAWEGLGYYSRARNLQNAVREVVETYGGVVPADPEELGNLKGVGPYTKGAILSIAYDTPEPAVDGNVMRVLSRILHVEDDISKQSTRKLFEGLVSELISEEDPSSFNQGLMELGALICTPKTPSCMLCPVQNYCRAFDKGIETELPVKSSKKKQKKSPYLLLLVQKENGEVLIEQRPNKGLLASLWQYPMVPLQDVDKESVLNWFYGEYGVKIELGESVDRIKHVFSHLIWEMEVIKVKVKEGSLDHERAKFIKPDDMDDYPFPVSHQKAHPYISQ
ncbi:A/G-specific DNA-adenine glycosylase [Halobacillus karajensis]|uniref:Adenine DNA glycosylase n=1 Tax=Halobacillus karajensis TaxID=195088 RepID=A0A024P749_9BACI|nr:A/G-specific adenine glycosylase [Halobacillus karajensis]CDQ20374.1 putative A/G-specific adenine glycosylase YfhQ [Halobacillus karajensis]CDQ24157.1 putative A/G-specific adenine glycosylase YfhQ [Halobacillus karajensis]CDQ27635.1 putative A/G-specific adenine glycosylase YfhQ [Halobacillus karajensis]SEH92643.1 A/G-specific DNA-adenine glycosylase [Halobacillus karajensis]